MAIEYGSGTLEVTLEGPFGTGANATKMVSFTAPADGWKGGESPYFQSVEVPGITAGSKVDIQLSAQQLQRFHAMDLALTTENDGGAVTLYAIGDKPTEDMTLQATLTEVVA